MAHFFAHRGKIEYNTGMEKTITLTLTDKELKVIEEMFQFFNDMGLPSNLEDLETDYDSLFDKVFGGYE